MQDGKVVAYESRKLESHEVNYAPHDLEVAVIVHCLADVVALLIGEAI